MTEGMDHTSSKSDSKKTSSPRNRYAFIGVIIGIAFIRIFRDEGSSFDEVLTGTFWGLLFGLVQFFLINNFRVIGWGNAKPEDKGKYNGFVDHDLEKEIDVEKSARIGLVISTLTGVTDQFIQDVVFAVVQSTSEAPSQTTRHKTMAFAMVKRPKFFMGPPTQPTGRSCQSRRNH